MGNVTFEKILKNTQVINEKRDYWFVRTQSGNYFDDFYNGNFISIGWNEISKLDIENSKPPFFTEDIKQCVEILGSKIKRVYKEKEKRPNHVALQLLRFSKMIKEGDIVLIPNTNSNIIAIGEIESSILFEIDEKKDLIDKSQCPWRKRKNIKWIKKISRNNLDPRLYKLMFTHQTVTDANEYAENIDRIINSFYIKKNKGHLLLNVRTTKDIKAKELFGLGTILIELIDEFAKEEKTNLESDDLKIKLNLQSPGIIEICSLNIQTILFVGIIFIAIAGGGFKLKYKDDKREFSSDFVTDGIIEKVRLFLKSKGNLNSKSKLIEEYVEKLEIKNADDFTKIIEKLNDEK